MLLEMISILKKITLFIQQFLIYSRVSSVLNSKDVVQIEK